MRLVFIFSALVVAIAAAMAFWKLSGTEEPVEQTLVVPVEPAQVQVQEQVILVARQDVPIGKRITENDIDRQPWPAHLVHEEFIPQGGEIQLIDMVARSPFKKNEPFAASRLANPNDPSFLAAQLPKGMRAVTVAIDAITGVNGFISPGDRVDVLIKHEIGLGSDFVDASDIQSESESDITPKVTTTQQLPLESQYQVPLLMSSSKRGSRPGMEVTEVLLSNIKILAVGQQSYQYENASNVPTNVTLEVTELQAQRLRHADSGELSLALRSLEDGEDMTIPRPIADADMTRLTPPSYFPYVYGEGDYEISTMSLEETGYNEQESDQKGKGNQITVIRGVEKEILGVDRP